VTVNSQLVFETRYDNGRLRFSAGYSNGQLDGECESRLANGDLESEGLYKEGKRVGKWTIAIPDEASKIYLVANFVNDVKSGPAEIVNKRGFKLAGGQYVNDQRQDLWKENDPVNQTTSTGHYDHDVKVGRWLVSDSRRGRKLRYINYDHNGDMIAIIDLTTQWSFFVNCNNWHQLGWCCNMRLQEFIFVVSTVM